MFRALLLLAAVALLVVPGVSRVAAQETTLDYAAIDRYVQDQMDDSRIPGVALAIVAGNEIVHTSGFGSAGGGRDVTPQTPFPLGSLIKSFTALAAMQLVEAGRLDLDAPVQRYLPWFRVADAEASSRITVRQLANQTSGLSRETGIEPLFAGDEASLEELVRGLADEELNRPVGARYEYSNANFMTLALIVETVAGKPFDRYLHDHILGPLGMTNSSAADDASQSSRTSVSRYWFGVPRAVDDAYQPSEFQGEYLIASAEDMARYLGMYLGEGTYDGTTLLTPAGIEAMLTPATIEATTQLLSSDFTFRYGMGWFAGPFGAGEDTRWHLGELPYFNAWMVLLPERDLGVVVLINAGSQLEFAGANEVFSRIPLGVVNLIEGETPPTGASTVRFYAVFDLIVLAIVASQLWALVRLARRPLALVRPRTLGQGLTVARWTAPLLWELGLGALILVGWPAATGLGWRGSWLSFPDLTLVLIAVGALWLATGLLRLVRIMQAALVGTGRHSMAQSRTASPVWTVRA